MGLAKRIIPVILTKGDLMVKGKQFACDRIVGNALQAAKIHALRGVDELMILDVTATKEGREPNYGLVRKLAAKCFSPLTVGGGVSKSEHVRGLLNAGADKVCIKSAYCKNIEIIKELSNKYGAQCITVAIDYLSNDKGIIPEYAKVLENHGAGEILLQAMDKDGTMEGFDLEAISEVSKAVSVPVIASGGCSEAEDAYQAIQAGADAVAIGALFQYTEETPATMAHYLGSKGVEVRID